MLLHTIVSVVKQLSSDITRFFAGHYSMSGANIEVCKPAFSLVFHWFPIGFSLKLGKVNTLLSVKINNTSFCNLLCYFCHRNFWILAEEIDQSSLDKKHYKICRRCNSNSKRANIKLESHHYLNAIVVQHTSQYVHNK